MVWAASSSSTPLSWLYAPTVSGDFFKLFFSLRWKWHQKCHELPDPDYFVSEKQAYLHNRKGMPALRISCSGSSKYKKKDNGPFPLQVPSLFLDMMAITEAVAVLGKTWVSYLCGNPLYDSCLVWLALWLALLLASLPFTFSAHHNSYGYIFQFIVLFHF